MADTSLGATPLPPTPRRPTLPAGLVLLRPTEPPGISAACSGPAAAGGSAPERRVVQSWGGGAAFRAGVKPQPSAPPAEELRKPGRLLPPGNTILRRLSRRSRMAVPRSTLLLNRGAPPVISSPPSQPHLELSAETPRLVKSSPRVTIGLGQASLNGARTSQASLPPGGVPLR